MLLIWTRLEIFVSKCLISLFHLHLRIYNKNSLWKNTIRPSSSALSIPHFSHGNFTIWMYSITILWKCLKVIWKMFVKKQKNPTHPPLKLHQIFQCFVIMLLKWIKYKNRPTFGYYSITFWDFKSLQNVPKSWQLLKTKNLKPKIWLSYFLETKNSS